jgi:hypothetical protein
MSEYDNTNTGALYPAEHMAPVGRAEWDDLKILRQGKVDIEGTESRMVLTQSTTRDGKTYFEVYQAMAERGLVAEVTDRDGNKYFEFYKKIGPIYPNDRKRTERDADMSGTVIPGDGSNGEYMIWGRKRETKSGVKMTSVSLAPKEKKTETQQSSGYQNNQLDDDTPF